MGVCCGRGFEGPPLPGVLPFPSVLGCDGGVIKGFLASTEVVAIAADSKESNMACRSFIFLNVLVSVFQLV